MAYTASQDPTVIGAYNPAFADSKTTAITPSDASDLSGTYPLRLLVITAGTLSVIPARNDDSDTVSLGSLPVGYVLNLMCRRVRSTGTTATVVGLHN